MKHPNFDFQTPLYDIAVLKLTQKVVLNRAIQLACLPTLSDLESIYTSQTVYMPGWGSLTANRSSQTGSNTLQNIELILSNFLECTNIFPQFPKYEPTQLCAIDRSGGGPCDGEIGGDSGSGLYTRHLVNGSYKYVLIGMDSYGAGCEGSFELVIFLYIQLFLRIDFIFSY
jgi:hypothetical protein